MSIIDRHLSLKMRQFGRRHALVMTVAAVAALITATAPFSATPASAPLHAHGGAASTPEARADQSPVIVRSLGYVEFDWSDGVMPGFGPLPAAGDSGAGL